MKGGEGEAYPISMCTSGVESGGEKRERGM